MSRHLRSVRWLAAAVCAALLGIPSTASASASAATRSPIERVDTMLFVGRPEGGMVQPDGSAVLFRSTTDRPGDRTVVRTLPRASAWSISPSGDRLAMVSIVSGATRVTVSDLAGHVVAVSGPVASGTTVADWSRDGSRLLLLAPAPAVYGAPPSLLSSWTAETTTSVQSMGGAVYSAAFDPQEPGAWFVIDDRGVVRSDPAGSQVIVSMDKLHNDFASGLRLVMSPDGERFFVVGYRTRSFDRDGIDQAFTHSIDSRALVDFGSDGRWLYVMSYFWLSKIPIGHGDEKVLTPPSAITGLAVRFVRTAPTPKLVPHHLVATPAGQRMELAWAPLPPGARRGVLVRYNGEHATGRGTVVYSGTARRFNDAVVLRRTYTYALYAVDAAGRRHGPTALTAVATSQATVRLPRTLLSQLWPDPRPVTLSWRTPANAASTVYDVEASIDSVAAGTTSAVTPDPSAVVTAIDHYGNRTRSTRARTVVPQDDAELSFRGTWTVTTQGPTPLPQASPWLGTLSSAQQPGAAAQVIAMPGTQQAAATRMTLVVIGQRGPGHGQMAVRIGGRQVAVVDTEAAQLENRVVLWTANVAVDVPTPVSWELLDTPGRNLLVLDGFAAYAPL